MLTDSKIQALTRKTYTDTQKFSDRDGLYLKVTKTGVATWRWDFWLGGRDGRRGTMNFGRYPAVSLSDARKALIVAKSDVAQGIDPARKLAAEKAAIKAEKTVDFWWKSFLEHSKIADSTRAMRESIYKRDILKPFGKLKLSEISEADVRRLCDKIVDRGAPATAIHVRDILIQIFSWARIRGEKVENVPRAISPSAIAVFKPRERNLTPSEIGVAINTFDDVGSAIAIKSAAKLLFLTFVRKSELAAARWDEIDFDKENWTIPAERMKKRTAHVVPLSAQALDILIGLKSLAGSSEYVLPGRYDTSKPMTGNAFNAFFSKIAELATERGHKLDHFGPHDIRRTASTILHEHGFASDWIEKQLAHEQRGVRAVYNKAEYLEQRRTMMQAWADMIDAFVEAEKP